MTTHAHGLNARCSVQSTDETMAKRRKRKNPGLIELAATSDWKYGAVLSGICVLGAAVIIPKLFASSAVLHGLADIFAMLAWFMAFVFGAISLVRFLKQQSEAIGTTRASPNLRVVTDPSPLPAMADAAFHESPVESRTDSSITTAIAPERPDAWSLEVLDRVEWKRFEDLCCEFYREKGIRAETTRLGADGGIDIHLFQNEADPTQLTAIVQCKALSKQVGVATVRELRGVMAHEKVEKAFFMAPNGFTDDARTFAAANRITLLDGKLFLAMLQRLPEASAKRLLDFATEGDWTIPTCPSCGAKMTARDSKRGRFWGCSTYPRCNSTLNMRQARRPA